MAYLDLIVSFILMTSIIIPCHCHSWITCTDYLEENGSFWNATLCRAYPRYGWKYTSKILPHGQETGYDHKPTESQPCKPKTGDTKDYQADHYFAVYYPGQKVVITHPAKGHAADTRCTGRNVPDTSNVIYRSSLNATQDPTLTQFRTTVVADLGASPFGEDIDEETFITYPKPGFQNAPEYCKDQDMALATNSFYVPFMDPGNYVFMWLWAFTNENDLYSTCWDVVVASNRAERNAILQLISLPVSDLGYITTTSKTTSTTVAAKETHSGGAINVAFIAATGFVLSIYYII